jgi:hypothetical protein
LNRPLRERRPPPLRHHRMVTRSLILALCLRACHRLGPDGPETPAKTIRQASDMPRRAIAESCPAGHALVNAPQGTLGCHASDVGHCPAGHTWLVIHASLQHSLHLVTFPITRSARVIFHFKHARWPTRVHWIVQVSRYRGGGGFIWRTPLAGMCGIVEEQLFVVDGSQNSPY